MSDFLPIPPTYAVADPQVRAVLDALARNVQVTIDSIQAAESASTTSTLTSYGGGTSFGSPSSTTNVTNLGAAYTPQNLKDDLATGTVNVISGATNGTTIMKLSPTGAYVVFQHKDAIILGNTGAYTGDVRTALGITSTGIVGGYNDKTTGAWQSTFTIESATGNLTVLGTIKANSVIQVGAYLGTTLVSTVLADIGTKLTASSSYVLLGAVNVQNTGGIQAGSVTWNATTGVVTGGTGVVMTENGITGVKAGVVTFAIDGSGNAVFSGDISGSTGTFYGALQSAASGSRVVFNETSSSFITVYDSSNTVIYSLSGISGLYTQSRLIGSTASPLGSFYVSNASTGPAIGCQGSSGAGLYGTSTSGPGVWCNTSFRWGAYTYAAPDGGTDKYLRNDGTWALVSSLGGGTVTSVSMATSNTVFAIATNTTTPTFSATGGATGNLLQRTSTGMSWTAPSFDASVIATGTIAPARLGTGTPSSTTALLGNSTWVSINPFVGAIAGNSGTCSTTNNNISILGSTTTGVAGAYVGTVGSGATLTLNVQTTSPSDRRLKQDVEPCALGLDFVNRLQSKTYKLKADPRQQTAYGFIADEVADIVGLDSSLVYFEPDWQVGEETGFYTIHYPSYVAVLTKALQELSAKVTQLENRNVA